MIDLVSTFILVAAFADDLHSRKIHNKLLLGLLLFASLVVFTVRGVSGLGFGMVGMAEGLLLAYPLVLTGVLGAGDMKLFGVFGFTSDPTTILSVYIYALLAGAVIGVVRAALGGELLHVIRSTAAVAVTRGAAKPSAAFHIPYSAAMLLGWLTFQTCGQVGGLLS